jgi:hypothetical protein
LLRWTEYLLLVVAGVLALILLATGDFLDAAGATLLFWRVIRWLKTLQSRR